MQVLCSRLALFSESAGRGGGVCKHVALHSRMRDGLLGTGTEGVGDGEGGRGRGGRGRAVFKLL